MLLAVSAMSATVRFVFFLLALICFLLGTFGVPGHRRLASWTSLGLALFTVPWMWDALAAS